MLLYNYTDQILAALGQDPKVSSHATQYILQMIPAMLFFAFCDLQKRWMSHLDIHRVPLFASSLASILQIPLSYACVFHYEMGFQGIGLAFAFSVIAQFFTMVLHSALIDEISPAICFPALDTFDEVGSYLSISMKSVIATFSIMLALEILFIFAGILGTVQLSALTLVLALVYLVNQVSQGVMESMSLLFKELVVN